jgi:hypothetical protein
MKQYYGKSFIPFTVNNLLTFFFLKIFISAFLMSFQAEELGRYFRNNMYPGQDNEPFFFPFK